jgi:hypothetical protein
MDFCMAFSLSRRKAEYTIRLRRKTVVPVQNDVISSGQLIFVIVKIGG